MLSKAPQFATVHVLALFVALLTGACDPPQSGGSGFLLPDLEVMSIGPNPLVEGSRLTVLGAGFVPAEVADIILMVHGEVAGEAIEFAARPDWEGQNELTLEIIDEVAIELFGPFWASGADEEVFQGEIVVQRYPHGSAPYREVSTSLSFILTYEVTPFVTSLEPKSFYLGDVITLRGDGFLQPSEGLSLVTFEGMFTTNSPVVSKTISGLAVPAFPPDPTRRDELQFLLTPDIFGIREGEFQGTVRVDNASTFGETSASNVWEPGELNLGLSTIDSVDPTSATRGQKVDFFGNGLLPADGLLQAGVLVVLEGTFTPERGPVEMLTGDNALALFPDDQPDNTEVGVVLRVASDLDGNLTGLAKDAGIFEGSVKPMVIFGADKAMGQGVPLILHIGTPKQVVYLKFLPAFDEALESFGLWVERDAIIARVLEVAKRDYEKIHIEFVTEAPVDFVEYTIVEVGGEDPNQSGLLGLDNTAGKDVGNLRFDDVIGGFNADTRARGYAAYGGIFVAEILNFSPTLSEMPLTSTRFDDIFAPLVPSLGGQLAKANESTQGDARAQEILAAVLVLGNVVGNTISHEVGHSLGLAAIQGQFHNLGDNPEWIMDSGVYRPFEERAELDGFGPAVFSPANRDYLESILPGS